MARRLTSLRRCSRIGLVVASYLLACGQVGPLGFGPGMPPVSTSTACDAVGKATVSQSSGTRILDFDQGSGTYSITCSPGGSVSYLNVAAGGGGGGSNGGGGGGGQVLTGTATLPSTTTTITVGAGGGSNTSGGNTTIGSLVTSTGGGSGGHGSAGAGAQGGSGGGGSAANGAGGASNGTGTTAGGTASSTCPGGGGGANAVGTNGTTTSGGGGNGISSSLSGAAVVYGSGGGGGSSASGCGAGAGGTNAGNGNASGTGHSAPGNAVGAGGGGGSTNGGFGSDGHTVISYTTASQMANPQTLGASGGNGSAGSFTLTTANAVNSGDLLFACVFTGGTAGATISSLSDGTNTYTQAGGYVTTDTTSDILSLWYVQNAAAVSSGASLKATFSTNTSEYAIGALHAAGFKTSSALDTTANFTQSFAGTSNFAMTGTSITPGTMNEMAAGCAWTFGTGGTPVLGRSGSAFLNNVNSVLFFSSGTPTMGLSVDTYLAATTNSVNYNPSWFYTGTGGTKWATAFIAAFKSK